MRVGLATTKLGVSFAIKICPVLGLISQYALNPTCHVCELKHVWVESLSYTANNNYICMFWECQFDPFFTS